MTEKDELDSILSGVMQSFLKAQEECYGPGNEKTLTLTLPASRWKHLVGYLGNHSGMTDIENLLVAELARHGITFPPKAHEVRAAIKVDAKPLPDIERGQQSIKCECGGFCDRVDCTEKEFQKYDCGRGCCAVAFVCCKCKARYAGTQPSPEMD